MVIALEDTEHEASARPANLLITIAEPEGRPAAETTINIARVGIFEGRNAEGALQVVEVTVAIDNPGMQSSNARLTLHVTRDSEPVEDLELGSSLTFPTGPAEFKQRYFPMEGWTPGAYIFSVALESIDPNNNQPLVRDEAEAEVKMMVE